MNIHDRSWTSDPRRQNQYVTAVAGVAALTVVCWVIAPIIGYAAIAPLFLLGVLLAGMVLSRGPVLVFATASALSWNFLFIPPRFTLHIGKAEDALMFLTYFIVAIAVGSLTARLKAREHLAAQIHVAEESERLRKSLLDCVSHELKTPIAAIAAASEALVVSSPGQDNGERARRLAGEIGDGSRRLNRVVDSLLDMTRLESAAIKPKREWCDVRELIESALELEREAIGGRSVTINAPEDLPLVLVDHGLLQQALDKLVANAGSYTPPGLPIEITASHEGGALVISVTDHGPGLPAGDEQRVFEKFYRGEREKTGGLGLGLSIARGFVETQGGRVTAANRPDGGACFTITLPTKTSGLPSMEAAR